MASNIFYRLSDRNTRNGIQLFENFCKSGHILAEDIFKIRTLGTEYELPPYKFLNALLRKNRRYFNGEESYFVNLFYSNYNDDFPDPFVRIDILRWLRSKYAKEGPTKSKGLFSVNEIIRNMQIMGHNADIVNRELNYLVKRNLILTESLMNSVCKDDLIKISIPGLLHLNMLNNVTYLAACAEDVLFKNTTVMMGISKRLATNAYLSKLSMAITAQDMIQYLSSYRSEFCSHPESYIINGEQMSIYDLSDCKKAISKWIDNDEYIKAEFSNLQLYHEGVSVQVTVAKKSSNSLVCFFGINQNVKGFISAIDTRYQLQYTIYDTISENDLLDCEIIEFDYDHKSFQLKFIRKVE